LFAGELERFGATGCLTGDLVVAVVGGATLPLGALADEGAPLLSATEATEDLADAVGGADTDGAADAVGGADDFELPTFSVALTLFVLTGAAVRLLPGAVRFLATLGAVFDAVDVTDDTELLAEGGGDEEAVVLVLSAALPAEFFRAVEFFLLVETVDAGLELSGVAMDGETEPFSGSFSVGFSGTGTGTFPASNCDLMALKFLPAETVFLVTS